MIKYSFFPGCSLKSTGADYEMSIMAVCRALGIELEEIADWACCGSTPAHSTNHFLSVAMPAKTLATAAKKGDGVAVACAACYNRMKVANHELANDADLRRQVGATIGGEYDGSAKISHLIEILINDYTIDGLKAKVTKPLTGLKVACYYGCLLVRPPKIMKFDDPNNPTTMDRLVAATGAEPVNWEFKTECCGAAMSITRTDVVLKLCNDLLADAKSRGAEAIAVACPLCQSNLDLRQKDLQKKYGTSYGLPVLYFTQLIGLALGLDAKALGLGKLMVNPMPLLKQKGAV